MRKLASFSQQENSIEYVKSFGQLDDTEFGIFSIFRN